MFNIPLATLLFTSGNFFLVGQNVHYNRLTYRELKHAHKADERYRTAVLAALRGQNYDERIDTMHKIIEYLDKEIEQLVDSEKEVFERNGGLTPAGQNTLHVLLENRKELKKLIHENQAAMPINTPASALMENPVKSYFGGA